MSKVKLQSNGGDIGCEFTTYLQTGQFHDYTTLEFSSSFEKAKDPNSERNQFKIMLTQEALNILIDQLLEAKHDYLQTVPQA